MYDKNSGRSRGFGFVQFSNNSEAKCAKDAMDGKHRRKGCGFLGRASCCICNA
uniref:RRM domain-containing protein n=1 Tax=Aegilops tauschii subsp. strangulata TaxID=200361 RepID=A0A453HWC0_AEGTS